MSKGYSYLLESFVWVPWKNTSSETCPAFGCFRVTDNTGYIIQGTKPDSTLGKVYGFNSQTATPPGKTGMACFGPIAIAKYDTGTPANGEGWGPKSGQWTLSKNYPKAATVNGIINTTDKTMSVQVSEISKLLGKADADIAKGASGTVSIWIGASGSESDSTYNVTAFALASIETCSHDWVTLENRNGVWYCVPVMDYKAWTGYSGSVQQALTHDASGCLTWVDIEECP